jgi:hypothetical protein
MFNCTHNTVTGEVAAAAELFTLFNLTGDNFIDFNTIGTISPASNLMSKLNRGDVDDGNIIVRNSTTTPTSSLRYFLLFDCVNNPSSGRKIYISNNNIKINNISPIFFTKP